MCMYMYTVCKEQASTCSNIAFLVMPLADTSWKHRMACVNIRVRVTASVITMNINIKLMTSLRRHERYNVILIYCYNPLQITWQWQSKNFDFELTNKRIILLWWCNSSLFQLVNPNLNVKWRAKYGTSTFCVRYTVDLPFLCKWLSLSLLLRSLACTTRKHAIPLSSKDPM